MKWNIWRIYQNFDEHVDRVVAVVLKLIPKIREVYANYEHAFDEFHEYWETACQDGSFYEKLKNKMKLYFIRIMFYVILFNLQQMIVR